MSSKEVLNIDNLNKLDSVTVVALHLAIYDKDIPYHIKELLICVKRHFVDDICLTIDLYLRDIDLEPNWPRLLYFLKRISKADKYSGDTR